MARTAQLAPQIQVLHKRLDNLAERTPDLAEPIAFYRTALTALYAAQAQVEPVNLPAEVAQHKLALGVPLLVGEDLPLDVEAAGTLFLSLCQVMESQRSPTQGPDRLGQIFTR